MFVVKEKVAGCFLSRCVAPVIEHALYYGHVFTTYQTVHQTDHTVHPGEELGVLIPRFPPEEVGEGGDVSW